MEGVFIILGSVVIMFGIMIGVFISNHDLKSGEGLIDDKNCKMVCSSFFNTLIDFDTEIVKSRLSHVNEINK